MLAVRGTLFFFIIFIFCTTAKGQNYIVDHLTVEDGLPSNWVDAVFEDEDGFIWIGTTQGFARYDGQKITSYFSNWKDSTSLMVSPWVTNIQAHNEHSLIIFKGGRGAVAICPHRLI
jgi:ligand-binding sensor domain-containing protein